jgi:hypothetical protein
MTLHQVKIPSGLDPLEYRQRICRASIIAEYGSLDAFAAALGVTRQSIYFALTGRYPGGRVAGALATLTGIPLRVLFPSQEKAA